MIDLQKPIEGTSHLAMLASIRKNVKKINPEAIISTMLKYNLLIAYALFGTKYRKHLILRESCKRSIF